MYYEGQRVGETSKIRPEKLSETGPENEAQKSGARTRLDPRNGHFGGSLKTLGPPRGPKKGPREAARTRNWG